MGTVRSPSDYTTINVDYSTGSGFYTDKGAVSDLLQVSAFSASTNPTQAQVGSIIKRVEGIIDDKVKRSFRPIITQHEYHNFEFIRHPARAYYGGYVGYIQLSMMKVRKIVSLQVWQGSSYIELASAQAKIELLDNYRDIYSIVLQLPNSGTEFEMLSEDTGSLQKTEFNTSFGEKTTANELVALINEQFPSPTAQFTGATEAKELVVSSRNISDFFYAQKNTENSKELFISSLLAGEDGSDCTIKVKTQQAISHTNASTNLVVADSSKLVVGMEIVDNNNHIPSGTTITAIVDSTNVTMSASATNTGSGTGTFIATNTSIPTICTVTQFTDKQDVRRLGSFWNIGEEGKIFFLQDYPYHTQNSIIVSYIAGDNRVPAAIHEAATKLVAAEILRHDDQTILIADTGGNISTKEKYDILRKEGMDILKGKGDLVYFLG
mgnify:CR=1 FL=1|tara:strand:+ start:301 stop:1611 length:1311 start_codon:yes stop_codon:yes gene_type:complete